MTSNTTSEPDAIEWYPIRQLLGHPGHEFTLIVLHQPIRDPDLFKDLWSIAESKIAADGGANQIYELSQQQTISKSENGTKDTSDSSNKQFKDLDAIIGDLDSLSTEARAYFTPGSSIIQDKDQYSTDFSKAVRLARRRDSPPAIVCMGGLGGRVDQGLSQLHHLYLFQQSPTYADGRMYLVSGHSLSFVLKGGRWHLIRVREPKAEGEVEVANGDGDEEQKGNGSGVKRRFRRVSRDPFAKHVGIVPVGKPARISTKGLEWDVQDWPTAFGTQMSTSNHVLPETEVVEIWTDEDVLFTIALKDVPGL